MVQNQGASNEMGEEGDEMDDMISRQAVINEMKGMYTAAEKWAQGAHDDDTKARAESCMATNVELKLRVEKLPSVQPQRWIPVTEALPDRGKTVLITNDKGNVRCGRFRGVEFWKDDGDAYWTFKGNTVEHVLAWMPLPECYKGGTE